MLNILIIIAQGQIFDTNYIKNYNLGDKPINSIWIHYYHLKQYLIKKNINFFPINLNNKFDLDYICDLNFDYCICIFNDINGYNKSGDNFIILNEIKQKIRCKFYLLTEVLNETNYNLLIKYFEQIFTNRDSHFKNTFSLGFSANEELLYPKKNKKFIRILIDHTAYNNKHFHYKDKTKFIITSLFDYTFDKKIIIRRFINGGIETVENKNINLEIYNRHGINILDAYNEYNRANIFFVTHPESMGMSVIESSMAGCLIVAPKNYIKPEFLRDLNYVEYDDKLDFKLILDKINPKLSRKLALNKTWDCFYDQMIQKINY